jgi:ABC-type antimicrobial peptide transport system permease subunit
VRLALGATPRHVVSLVVREGAQLLVWGLALGLLASALAARSLRRFLFEVAPLDPVTLIAAPALLAVAALVASYLPARRAGRVSPVAVLRRWWATRRGAWYHLLPQVPGRNPNVPFHQT